jgi:hypothetical protein
VVRLVLFSAAPRSNPIKQIAKQINQICQNFISIKQIQNPRFEITFDIFDTQYAIQRPCCQTVDRAFTAYPEPGW